MEYLDLDLSWERCRKAVYVQFTGVVAFRFEENLMPFGVWESEDLVFYRWTVARATCRNRTTVHR